MHETNRRRTHAIALVGCGLVLLWVLISTAWVGEDPRITFRTIDNFVNGYGLRWNVDERVQTYTHPLWLFALSSLYFFTREIDTTATLLGLACSISAFAILAHQFRQRNPLMVVLILALLLSSRALTNFGTSGFENPLSHLLLVIFACALLRSAVSGESSWLLLSGATALAIVNRLDAALLYLPAWVVLLAAHWPRVAWKRVALGSLPLAAWLAFSLFYYGFWFPNTAPAKLAAAVPQAFYTESGLRELLLLFHRDLGSGALLLLGLVTTGIAGVRFARNRERAESRALASLGAGMLLYCVYVVQIGGDFLLGRFWSAPLWLAVVLGVYHVEWAWRKLRAARMPLRIATVAALVAAVFALRAGASHLTLELYGRSRVGLLVSSARSLLEMDGGWRMSEQARKFHASGEQARREAEGGRRVAELSAVGFAGIAAGRDVIILDANGLADPLIARLRPRSGSHSIGHLLRPIPQGYAKARETGSPSAMHPALREYYAVLRLITSGPLWSWERIEAIVRFNLGEYDHLLERYERALRRRG